MSEGQITASFRRVVKDRFFRYRGVQCERIIGGYKVLQQKALTMDEVDDIIDASLSKLKKSVDAAK